MKKLHILVFLVLTTVASATSYYISPNGNDSNNGTISSPFFTLNKAWTVIKAGDIIYVRGGVYRFNSRQTLSGKSGTVSDTIRVWAYPGERPVFTKSSSFATPSWPVSLIYLTGSYTHFRGIEIAHFTQKSATIWYGIALRGANHNKFERINSHHNGHGMVIRDDSNHNLVLNSDFHHNYDPLTTGDAYGDADGLEVAYLSSSMENSIIGCRLWNNSDDGIDLWNNNGNVIIDGCWAWNNGYREDGRSEGGDGGGFKLGSTTTTNGSEFKRTVKNCVSVFNRTRGYNQNSANAKVYFYNNLAYRNPEGVVFTSYNLPHIYRNNIVFSNGTRNWVGQFSNAIKDHNSFDSGLPSSGPVASTADFISIDTTGISKPRQSDGSMPAINMMKLAVGSDMIDAGVNVGTSFAGKAPDLGPFEFKTGAIAAPVASILTYVASTINKTTPSEVDVAYSAIIASTIIPSLTSFEIKVNSVIRSVNKITIADKNVRITLATPVNQGDVVTLSYTKPSVNPLQCLAGTQAETIISKTVSNPVEAAAAPLYLGSVVENASPDKIELTYNSNLANTILPAASAFITMINGKVQPVKSVAISQTKVLLTLPVALKKSDTVTISYSKPALNPLQSLTGGIAESISDQKVLNNITLLTSADTTNLTKGLISVFPNPASDFIKISNLEPSEGDMMIRIYDFSGKLVQETKLDNITTNTRKVPIDLKPGLHIIQLVTGKIVRHVAKIIAI